MNSSSVLFYNESDYQTCPNLTLGEQQLIDVVEAFCWYATPFIVALGTFGNVASVAVFFTTKMSTLSSYHYLAALAFSDTGFLFALFLNWFDLYTRPGFCQTLIYVSSVCAFLSVWLVLAFTVERFIAVCYPLRRPSMCTVARARAVIIALTVLALGAYSLLLAVTQTNSGCNVDEEFIDLNNVLHIVDSVVTFVVPSVGVLTLNLHILRCVWHLHRIRRTMTQGRPTGRTSSSKKNHHHHQNTLTTFLTNKGATIGGGDNGNAECRPTEETALTDFSAARVGECVNNAVNVGGGGGGGGRGGVARVGSQTKITQMLLVISFTFLALNSPAHCLRLWINIRYSLGIVDEENCATIVVLQKAFDFLFNLNFAINFLLYCLSGQNFRRALKAIFSYRGKGVLSRRSKKGDYFRHSASATSFRRSHPLLNGHRQITEITTAI